MSLKVLSAVLMIFAAGIATVLAKANPDPEAENPPQQKPL
uniref:Venom peptide n=1 Tax=Dasymutilla sicheliana TaxID=1175388 RepID=A0A8T9VT32_DASSI|nr:venom peptide precursor [Dasymutilla sicheliana]